jgi:hypothetical protein
LIISDKKRKNSAEHHQDAVPSLPRNYSRSDEEEDMIEVVTQDLRHKRPRRTQPEIHYFS